MQTNQRELLQQDPSLITPDFIKKDLKRSLGLIDVVSYHHFYSLPKLSQELLVDMYDEPVELPFRIEMETPYQDATCAENEIRLLNEGQRFKVAYGLVMLIKVHHVFGRAVLPGLGVGEDYTMLPGFYTVRSNQVNEFFNTDGKNVSFSEDLGLRPTRMISFNTFGETDMKKLYPDISKHNFIEYTLHHVRQRMGIGHL